MPRVPPHFKVRTSLMNHPKMVEVARDNDLLALYVRLGTMAIERFADRTDDSFVLHKAELLWATGRERASTARALLHRLCASSPIDAVERAGAFTIHIPNLAEKQGFAKRNGDRSCTPLPLPLTTTSKPPTAPRVSGSAGKGKAKDRKPAEPKIPCPGLDRWTEEQFREIIATRNCTPATLKRALAAVIRWHEDGASKAARVTRTRRRWVIYLRDQDWPYEGSGNGNGRATPGYTPPPAEFQKAEGTPVAELSEAEREQAAKDTAAVRQKLGRAAARNAGANLSGEASDHIGGV